jgi:hypothetical protein
MSDAVKYFQKNGHQASKQLVEMGFGFVSLEDDLSFHSEQLKQLVESHELVKELGGLEKATLHLISTDKRLGYTHVYLHSNGRYCFLDDYVDFIPDQAINIKSAIKAIADVKACIEVS